MSEPFELEADCARCAGLCCVALPFAAGADFALDKAGGEPCPNLGVDFRCGIHDRLRGEGFSGCVAFDCHGAGQQVTQLTFGGRDWRSDPAIGLEMFAAFRAMRPLHELLAHLAEATGWPSSAQVADELAAATDRVEQASRLDAASLVALDVGALRQDVAPLLRRASALARAAAWGDVVDLDARDLAGADLFGADRRGVDLRGADLRGAVLVGADLRGADLRSACLLGADLRGADVRGADLGGALFVTRAQLHAARGDARTVVPAGKERPAHW